MKDFINTFLFASVGGQSVNEQLEAILFSAGVSGNSKSNSAHRNLARKSLFPSWLRRPG